MSTLPLGNKPLNPRDQMFDGSHLQTGLGAGTGHCAVTVLLFAAFKLVLATTAVLPRLIPPAEHGLLALAIPLVMVLLACPNSV